MIIPELEIKYEEWDNKWIPISHFVEAHFDGESICMRADTDAHDYAKLDKQQAIELRDWLNVAIEVME